MSLKPPQTVGFSCRRCYIQINIQTHIILKCRARPCQYVGLCSCIYYIYIYILYLCPIVYSLVVSPLGFLCVCDVWILIPFDARILRKWNHRICALYICVWHCCELDLWVDSWFGWNYIYIPVLCITIFYYILYVVPLNCAEIVLFVSVQCMLLFVALLACTELLIGLVIVSLSAPASGNKTVSWCIRFGIGKGACIPKIYTSTMYFILAACIYNKFTLGITE